MTKTSLIHKAFNSFVVLKMYDTIIMSIYLEFGLQMCFVPASLDLRVCERRGLTTRGE